MKAEKQKTTAPIPSVGADGEQSKASKTTSIIPAEPENINKNNGSLQTISMTELYNTSYEPKPVLIDGLLCAGMHLFVGAPKIGKSFFMAQLGYHVAMGIPLWTYNVHQGTVLYLALEDDYSRLQKRLSQMFGVDGCDHLYFATQAKTLSTGLDEQLCTFLKEHPDTKLVIIDTLQKVREVGGERYNYASDYEIVARLKTFSDAHKLCMLVVHHTRKMEAADSFDMISGTNGLLGAADGAFIMQKKKRTDNTAVMEIVGRDQSDQELTLAFDREQCVWKFVKAETEPWKAPVDPVLEKISTLIKSSPEWQDSPTELLACIPDLDMQPNVLTRYLNVNAARLFNEYGILYEGKRTHEGRLVKLTRVCDNP